MNGWGLRPIYDHIDLDYTAQVKKIKDSMWVEFNRARYRFLVKDRDLKGDTYVYMIVQEPNGDFRPFDERTLETIRKDVFRGPDVQKILNELETIEANRLKRVEKDDEELAYGFAHDFKWVGKDVVPSVVSAHRGLAYEQKVQQRKLEHSTSMRESIRAYARS